VIGQRGDLVFGVELSSDAARAVVLDHGRIIWSGEAPIGPDASAADALHALATEALGRRTSHARLAVAVGPANAQLRRLHGLPRVSDARTLSAIVQQSAGRYFRQNGTPMITTPLGERAAEGAWAGAIEEPVVDVVAELGRTLRFTSTTLVPAAELLGHAAPDCGFTWRDGGVALELRYDSDRLASCRCLPSHLASGEHGAGAALVPALRALGDDGVRWAGAYGAAVAGSSSALALRPPSSLAEPTRRRIAAAGLACAAGLTFSLVAPSIAAARAERSAATRLATLSATAVSAERTERSLSANARLLSQLAEFQRSATSKTLLLASLTCAIDDETTLLSLQLEPSGGTLSAITPSAASLLGKLESIPEIASPAIVGSVTPDAPTPQTIASGPPPAAAAEASTPMSRVTVHFEWRDVRRDPTKATQCES
jgi:hypothetical protein